MPRRNPAPFDAAINTIGQALIVRKACYGEEHRPPTRQNAEAREAATKATEALAPMLHKPKTPWDLHLTQAALHFGLAQTPEDAYNMAGLLAAICIQAMIDLHPNL